MTLRKYIVHLIEEEDVKNSKSSEDLRNKLERCKAYNRILKDPLLQSVLDQKIDTEIKKYYNSPAGLLELTFNKEKLLSIKFKSDEHHPMTVDVKVITASLVDLHSNINSDEWLMKRYPNTVEVIKNKIIDWISVLIDRKGTSTVNSVYLFNTIEGEE